MSENNDTSTYKGLVETYSMYAAFIGKMYVAWNMAFTANLSDEQATAHAFVRCFNREVPNELSVATLESFVKSYGDLEMDPELLANFIILITSDPNETLSDYPDDLQNLLLGWKKIRNQN